MLLRYRFRIYPTLPQRRALAQTFGCVRVVYNDAVAARIEARRAGRPFPSAAELDRRLITEAKRTPERAWLAEVSTVPLQQALRDCNLAYQHFFASIAGRRPGAKLGPPRFKRRCALQSARYNRNGFRMRDNGRLYVAKVGEVKVAWSRELPSTPSSVTVIKTATDKYYASFVVTVGDDSERLPEADHDTGIDLGLKDFAVLRGGEVIANPKFFKRLERKLRSTQRSLSRKQPGSKNRERARLKVARVHEKVRHSRSDWIDKQVKTIVAENQGIFVEDLNVKGLSRSRLAKSIRDAAFGIFLSRLESKAARAGRAFVKVDRFFPSTQLCSTCGVLSGPRGIEQLGVRRWVCRCGARHERDANAELNIRREGQRVLAQRLWER
jgi:putative transposase